MIRAIVVLCLAIVALERGAYAAVNCGGSTSSKTVTLTPPTHPPRNCVYNINAYSSNVCQLRLEFDFELAGPSITDNGVECVTDYLQIGDLKLCGREEKQHVYVTFNRTAGIKSIPIEVATAARIGGSGLPNPSWSLRVNQLECPSGSALFSLPIEPMAIKDGYLVAPTGCTQYYPDPTGVIQSFNYQNGRGGYSGNMNYAICFRRREESTGLKLTALDFNLRSESTTNAFQTDELCYPQVKTNGRIEDYLLIAQATVVEQQLRGTYFCGKSLANSNINSDAPGTVQVIFKSGNGNSADVLGKGFSFRYAV